MRSVKALHQCKGIVAIGGGHGLGRVLASLGFLGDRVSGIVTTTDNGGSTGRLRKASGCIALGDLRHCLSQLCSDSPTLARNLFEYRYQNSGELSGHVLGNLVLLALDQMLVRPLQAINVIRQMLQIEARLFPMSEQPASLGGIINGEQVTGEKEIDCLPDKPEKLLLLPDIKPTLEALAVVEEADLIILGPGSFMTSVLPALLMQEMADRVKQSTALKVFIGNMKSENSAIKKLTVSEKLLWMENLTGVYPDVLLWPDEREVPGNIKCRLYRQCLRASSGLAIHSRGALRSALEQLVAGYISSKNCNEKRKGLTAVESSCS